MIQDILLKLGLNQTQIKIYLMLLKAGTSPASILGKRTNTPRSTARYTCQQLANKGIIIATKRNNTLLFTPKDPRDLNILLENDKKEIQEKEKKLNQAISELKNLYNPQIHLPKVTYYEGIDEVIKLIEDNLKTDGTTYSALKMDEVFKNQLYDYVQNHYLSKAIKHGGQVRSIFCDNKLSKDYAKLNHKVNRISLFVPEQKYSFAQYFHIYDDSVVFLSSTKGQIYGVKIQDENTRNTQLAIFKLAWDYARTLKINEKYKDLTLD